jgi:hypothetical protein
VSASTAPGVKDALIDLLEGRPALAGVTIRWAGPSSPDEVKPKMIWFGKTERDSEWSGLGAKSVGRRPPRREEYTVKVVVYRYLEGNDPKRCEQDCEDIVTEIEEAIFGDVTLGGLLAEWAEVKRVETETMVANESGWNCEAVLDVRCVAKRT